MLGCALDAQVLVDRGFVVLDGVAGREEELAQRGEVVEPTDAWPQQLEDREEPRAAVADELVAPQALRLERRLDAGRELVRREPRDVLLIEPVELLLVEDRVPSADAFQREQRDELVAREDLAIRGGRAGRPAEERQEIRHRFRQESLPRV